MSTSTQIPLSRPDISDLERHYVQDVMHSSQLALGPMLSRFEVSMASLCQTRHAVAVSSGTAALHLIVRGLGIGPGDEVITTPFSFIASSNCLLYERAIPKFVDIHPDTLAIDPTLIEEAIHPRTKAILAIDVFGFPAPWPQLEAIAKKYDLLLIDDACEAPGASIDNKPIGSWGHAAAFGFYPNKQITTAEGGCITTDDDSLAEICRSMSNQGRSVSHKMDHTRLGYNYRMDELSAAIGCAQLERLPELLRKRHNAAALYSRLLHPFRDDLKLPGESQYSVRSWFVYVIQLEIHYSDEARDLALELLRNEGIGCAPYFPSIHLQPLYREQFGYTPGTYPICESVSDRSIALPFFPSITPDEIERVVQTLVNILPQLPQKERTLYT